ncbi:MAG: peptide deformylase [Firmicutes bacterium]|nr:peptide deformylase [Bacillota bacterium]
MAIRQIVKIGDELLRQESMPVTVFDERVFRLLDDMRETLEHEKGAGLAAVQVGVLKRVFIITVGKRTVELINPEIVKESGEITDDEGCLSIPGERGLVMRPAKVKVKAFDRRGNMFMLKLDGYEARAFCHELDHLNGVLYIDKRIKK